MKDGDFQKEIDTVYMLLGSKYGRHVECCNCGLIYVNPVENGRRINQGYAQMESIDASVIRGSRLRAAKSQLRLIKKHHSGTNLLDVGCAEGFFLFNASKAGYTARGVELCQDAAAYAQTEFGLDVELGHFEESRFPENCFDVVTMWQVLEHVPYPLMFLKEVHKVLKPRGMVVVSTPNIGGVPARILKKRWWNIRRVHINQYTTETLSSLLTNAGFRKVSPVSYWECASLSMLLIPILKYLKLYESLKAIFYPSSILARAMDKIRLIYPSRVDNCIMLGFK
jgi:2-polyprenyl-3-methyl-5-hydroxy-6-metoxy-1,4-benzoquinol methylase